MIAERMTYDAHVRGVAVELAERESERMGILITAEELLGESRCAEVVRLRCRVAMLMHPLYSTTVIGRAFGRDHTTIIHYIRKRERELAAEHRVAA